MEAVGEVEQKQSLASPAEQTPSSAADATPMVQKLRQRKAAVFQRIGLFHSFLALHIEDPSIVVLFLLLSYVDIALGTWLLSSDSHVIVVDNARAFILHIQAFELALQLVAFHRRFFGHWGYAFDTALVAARFLVQNDVIAVDERQLVLLSFLRVWRFVLVVQTYVSLEVGRHHRTREELSAQVKSANAYKMDVEREKRLARQHREEIDTLREALKIAAVDVAAAAASGRYEPPPTGRVSPTDSADREGKDGDGGSAQNGAEEDEGPAVGNAGE